MNIPVIYSPIHKKHNPPFEIYDGVRESYAEKPERIDSIVNYLLKHEFELSYPLRFSERYIKSIHDSNYIAFLRSRCKGIKTNHSLFPSFFIRDTYTPIQQGTYKAARSAVDCSLTGAKYLLQGEELVYSLCRPPGHHAEYAAMGGYCYFNNAAIAAQYLSKKGKVAILDIDFHHGNGTQNIFYDRDDVLYISIHADPRVRFPYLSGFKSEKGRGKGYGYTYNYPLQLGTTNEEYEKIVMRALQRVRGFKSAFLLVSVGFDTYEHDPIGGFKLTIPFYETIGRRIHAMNLPTLLIQEGGYAVKDLGRIAFSFLKGFSD